MKVSVSEMSSFLKCRRLWSYTGDTQRRLAPKASAPALFLGSGVHEALEYWYDDGTDTLETFQTWVARELVKLRDLGVVLDEKAYQKLFELGTAMLKGYRATYGDNYRRDNDGLQVLVTEQEFSVPIPNTDGYLVGRMDGLCRDGNGLAWILESKTYTRAPTTLQLNLQTLAYTWAANQLTHAGNKQFASFGYMPGTRVHGSIFNGLRKQLPKEKVRDPLFLRQPVRRTLAELAAFQSMLTNIYLEMSNASVAVYPTLSYLCEKCFFQSPCLAAQVGDDESWILNNQYITRPSRGVVYEDSVEE